MPIGGVFADSKRLVVPIYQRTYEWTPERQIDTLIDYVEAKAEARLATEPARFLHYMGALPLIPRSGFVFGRIPVFDIVDGQQRITTFQIALAALRDLSIERGEQSIADQIRPLLFNIDEASMEDKKAERFKLEPSAIAGSGPRPSGSIPFHSVALHPQADARRRSRLETGSLLTGLIFDARGNLMSPTYSVRGGKRYRYYVSRLLVRGGRKEGSRCRVGAEELDRLVVEVLGQQLSVPELLSEAASGSWSAATRTLVRDNIERIVVGRGEIEIVWKATRTSSASGETGDGCDTTKGLSSALAGTTAPCAKGHRRSR